MGHFLYLKSINSTIMWLCIDILNKFDIIAHKNIYLPFPILQTAFIAFIFPFAHQLTNNRGLGGN